MPPETKAMETAGDRLQAILFRPPVSIEDLNTDIEHDPEGAEEFVALIRALRSEGSQRQRLWTPTSFRSCSNPIPSLPHINAGPGQPPSRPWGFPSS